MKKLLVAICACLVLGLVAAGCGGDDDDAADDGATIEQTAPTEAPGADETTEADGDGAAADGEQVEIEVVDIDYDPNELTVASGTTVTWTNTGDMPHTVTKTDGPGDDFDSGTLSPGDTFEQTLDTAGTIDYVCTIHPQQRGTLTVE